MTSPVIPLQWILEHAVTDPSKFKDSLILALCDQLASTADQPSFPPIVLIALLHRIFSHPNAKDICDVDNGILDTIEYLETLETQRLKRMKALEKRGGALVGDLLKTSEITLSRYNFSLICIKYWTVFNEIARVPFNPYNTLSLIATLFPEDSLSQTQTQQESPTKAGSEAQRRIEMSTLVNHISKGLSKMTDEERDAYDVSNHPTLVKNQDKMPWKKLVNVLSSYLDSTKILFQRSEIFINPERRIQGVRIDDKMIKLAAEALQREGGF